jgi:hypothetical protein
MKGGNVGCRALLVVVSFDTLPRIAPLMVGGYVDTIILNTLLRIAAHRSTRTC